MEMQEDTSRRGFGGVPQFALLFPQEWGIKGVESGLSDSLFRVVPSDSG